MGYIHKSSFNAGEGSIGRPDSLSEVNFESSHKTSKEANKNSGQHDSALWVPTVFREGSDSVEAYVRQRGVRGGHPNQMNIESLRIVKGLDRKDSVPTLKFKKITDRQRHEDDDHCTHDGYENNVGIRRSADSAQIQQSHDTHKNCCKNRVGDGREEALDRECSINAVH